MRFSFQKIIARIAAMTLFLALVAPLAQAQSAPALSLSALGDTSGENNLRLQVELSGFTLSARTPITVSVQDARTKRRLFVDKIKTVSADGTAVSKIWAGKTGRFIVTARAYVNRRWVAAEPLTLNLSSHTALPLPPSVPATPVPPETPPAQSSLPQATVLAEGMNLTGGLKRQFVTYYEFKASVEAWSVRKLTVVTDTQGDGFDADAAESVSAIGKVYLRYSDRNGNRTEVSSSLQSGRATFSNLDIYIPRNGTAGVEIGMDVSDPALIGATFSGQNLRLGLQETGNTASTFEAIGVTSGFTDNGTSSLSNTNSRTINEFVTRAAVPKIQMVGASKRVLASGENDVYQFSVTAQGGSVGLARLVFDVNASGVSKIDQVAFWRGNQKLTPGDAGSTGGVYLMWDAGGTSCFANTAQSGFGSGMSCNGAPQESAKLIVTFPQEEVISKDNSLVYRLSLNADGVTLDGNISVKLATDDENDKPAPLSAKIYNGGAGSELFSADTQFVTEASSVTGRNVVWSDRSGEAHAYPTVTPAALPTVSATGSTDYTNGYLLKITSLSPSVLSR